MDIFCDECGATFKNDCHCAGWHQTYVPAKVSTWRGMDGHKYTGDSKRASMASHDDDCGCPGSVNFDPDSWY